MLEKQFVVILPYQNGKVLMQLRDEKAGIVYPGYWGFFGGAVEPGETPIQCARRELYEEIAYAADEIFALSINHISVPHKAIMYSFYCLLNIPVEKLDLQEGFDFGLFTFEEVCAKQLFSAKAQKNYPVIDHTYNEYISHPDNGDMDYLYGEYLIRKLMRKIHQNHRNFKK